jgi:D-3-phosphoglycerate dehydrogenase
MSDTIEPLIVDLVSWIAKEERSYAEVMDAWRTSCPRLPVWEEANSRGLVARALSGERLPIVAVTDAGRALLLSRAQRKAGDRRPPVS